MMPIALDGIAVILYAICLLGARREVAGARPQLPIPAGWSAGVAFPGDA